MIAGVMFSVGCVIIFAGTFIPRGSFAINPEILAGDNSPDEEKPATNVIASEVTEAKRRPRNGTGRPVAVPGPRVSFKSRSKKLTEPPLAFEKQTEGRPSGFVAVLSRDNVVGPFIELAISQLLAEFAAGVADTLDGLSGHLFVAHARKFGSNRETALDEGSTDKVRVRRAKAIRQDIDLEMSLNATLEEQSFNPTKVANKFLALSERSSRPSERFTMSANWVADNATDPTALITKMRYDSVGHSYKLFGFHGNS
ncbi:hypothetical protein BJ741DRAFT_573352 [Chytriomyces cf. hyalinus JEL632]|nr:hypothetical protein BJ741DRAFT_581171 [Chytriomyces cf. hyalinus JEL632]KAI8845332.1 hypothetical protein BJ741DRAFT_573352 [Chytriomyces cf. hyalinus JEL632]